MSIVSAIACTNRVTVIHRRIDNTIKTKKMKIKKNQLFVGNKKKKLSPHLSKLQHQNSYIRVGGKRGTYHILLFS